jgi:MYXO-CTERM domain-containing protein
VWQQYDDASGVRSVRLIGRTVSDLPILLPDGGPPDAAPEAGADATAVVVEPPAPVPDGGADAAAPDTSLAADAAVAFDVALVADVAPPAADVAPPAVDASLPADDAAPPPTTPPAKKAAQGCSCRVGDRRAPAAPMALLVLAAPVVWRRFRTSRDGLRRASSPPARSLL